jgi:hypothetical protein
MDLTPVRRSQCNIELDIQEVVLVGVSVHQREELQQAIATELQRLFRQQGIPGSLAQATLVPHKDGGQVVPSSSTDPLGAEIARAIYRGLGG